MFMDVFLFFKTATGKVFAPIAICGDGFRWGQRKTWCYFLRRMGSFRERARASGVQTLAGSTPVVARFLLRTVNNSAPTMIAAALNQRVTSATRPKPPYASARVPTVISAIAAIRVGSID
jgi:hypothetical protein